MALTQVTGPYPIFTDLDGSPLDDGYLYIGAINEDPETNPIQVFWDSNLTIVATQPIRTSNGYAYRNGTPALLYTGGEFSITIRNKRQEFVLYSPVGYGFDPAAVSAAVVKNDFTGDGVEVDFALSSSPSTKLATNIFINGVYQEKDSYTLSGNVITFTIAPPLNSSIEVMTNETGIINSGNATAISYTLTAPGAVAQTVQTKLEQYVSVKDFGAVGDGVTDDTAAIQAALDASEYVYASAGTYLIQGLTLNDNSNILGSGFGVTIFKLDAAADANVFENADTGAGNPNISLSNFSIDGNYTNQSAIVHGVALTKCDNSYFDIEVYDCRGTGVVLSGGSGAKTSTRNTCYSNGKAAAGYGIYIFNHDDATIYGTYNDNCIGVAIEASGAAATASRCRVSVNADANRADFGQSGAGVHWEQSSGGSADDGCAIGCVCTNSTGVGINNTACNLTIVGGVVSGNTKSGVITSAAQGFLYSGIKMFDNGSGDAVGYRTSMRFDDSGLNPASVGEVIGCYATGSTVDGYKTLSANSAVTFTNNFADGFTNDYVLSSSNDVVSRLRQKGTFVATLTGVSGSVIGNVNYDLNGDIVTLTIPSAINGTSADTNPPTLTGLPAAIYPTVSQRDVGVATNNSANVIAWVDVDTSGVLTFYNGTSGTFAATGVKGVQQCQIVYRLT